MQPSVFFEFLKKNNLVAFYGVPDSLLKSLCAYISDNVNSNRHIIAANEGNAIAMACGYYLSTSNPAVVYMQNSGLGNCVNPLLSLSDEEVYNIPFLMIIGWRGQPNIKDEPQHIKQGKLTENLLTLLGIDYRILPRDEQEAKIAINFACQYMKQTKKPFALLIEKGTFDEYKLTAKKNPQSQLSREQAIECVIKRTSSNDAIIATTGFTSRELYFLRKKEGQTHSSDFLCVGSMGHASSIALSIAIENPYRNVLCFDGDGSFLMHMGSIAVNGSMKLDNFKHIVFNNQAHDSVGAQPTCTSSIEIDKIVKASGYAKTYKATNKEQLSKILPEFLSYKGTAFLEIMVKCGASADLGRPREHPIENKNIFMEFLQKK